MDYRVRAGAPALKWPILFNPRSLVRAIRRNHALEHATIHILTEIRPGISLVGRSDWKGYLLYGDVETAQVEWAAYEALARLKSGEHWLAVHPRCGTILATTGVLSGLAVFITLGISNPRGRLRWASLPEAILAATVTAVLAQPLGLLVERYLTTSADLGDLSILRVYRQSSGRLPVHRIETG